VTFLTWSPDGKRLASVAGGNPGEVKVWDAGRGQELATLSPGNSAGAVRFSPDGRFLCLAAAGIDGQQGVFPASGEAIPLWDLSTAPPRHAASVTGAEVVAPDNTVLARIGDVDVPVRPWTLARRVRLSSWEIGPASDAPVFTPDGKMVVLAGQTTAVRGKLGTWLARGAGDDNGYQYKWVDVDTWQVQAVLDTDAPGILSPDGRLLATGGSGRPIQLWRVPPRRPLGPILAFIGLSAVLVVFTALTRRRRRGEAGSAAPAVDPSPGAA
jgi:WD40 repeat protein